MVEATVIDTNVSEMKKMLEEAEVAAEDLVSIGEIRSAYATSIAEEPYDDKEKADEISAADLHAPLARPYALNPEEVPTYKETKFMLSNIAIDTIAVDHEVINTANKYVTLMGGMLRRLGVVRERLLRNRQRVEDINFICSSYAGLKDVQPLSSKDFTGKCTYANGCFAAAAGAMNQIKYDIMDIAGNGYVGNAYVLDEQGRYVQEFTDTGKLENIIDNSPTTVFEYSRLVNDDKGVYTPNVENKNKQTIVNFDDKDVECVISIRSADGDGFNTIVFSEPGKGLRVTQIETSNDGVKYKDNLGKAIELDGSAYTAKDYAPGCNLVMFPSSAYVKIHLASSTVADDFALGRDILSSDDEPTTIIERLNNAHRKVVSFGGIKAYSSSYVESALITNNLAPENGCRRIAIFANEYVPSTNAVQPVKYELIVNGETYEVKPINSDVAGIKLISSVENSYKNTGVKFIEDTIKTAQLKITFNVRNGETAFVGNIKACIG